MSTQRAYGANLFHNLMTMTGWAADFQTPIPDLYSTLSTTAWRSALWVLLGFAALAALAWRTTRLPATGLAWWLLALAPGASAPQPALPALPLRAAGRPHHGAGRRDRNG